MTYYVSVYIYLEDAAWLGLFYNILIFLILQ